MATTLKRQQELAESAAIMEAMEQANASAKAAATEADQKRYAQMAREAVAHLTKLANHVKDAGVALADRLAGFWFTDEGGELRKASGYTKVADLAEGWDMPKSKAQEALRLGVVRHVLAGTGLDVEMTSDTAAKRIVSGLTWSDDAGEHDCNMRGASCDYLDETRNSGLIARLGLYAQLRADGLGEIKAAEKAAQYHAQGYGAEDYAQAREDEAQFGEVERPQASKVDTVLDALKRLQNATPDAIAEDPQATIDALLAFRETVNKGLKAARSAVAASE